ncbi:YVTN family beta-propeller repeat protein [Mycobacterium bohemicum DSM 44277]|uniref:Uncharacterized protein n=2 Tax=Mycobacterium bohemicum TaxID=56425 RepID=A0A1X1R8X2_MYCBE|nr:hypothetical protein AWB93_07175 [Mycobacterium bohemicum]CPR08877.1 YVTN family beta-propeller repeat protein [Mycobacterium bohemicum DSM 44277]
MKNKAVPNVSKLNGRNTTRNDGQGRHRAPGVRIAVDEGPISDLLGSPDGGLLLAANYGRDSVSVIDTDTWRVTGTVAGLGEPFSIAMDGLGDRAYVSIVSPACDAIAVIDPHANSVVATHPLEHHVTGLAASLDGSRVYATRNGRDRADLAVLETATGRVAAVGLPTAPHATAECVRIGPDGARLYLAANGPDGGQLLIMRATDAPRPVATVGIGMPIRDVALSPDGALAYVASCAPDEGAVVDAVDTRTHRITGTRKVGDVRGMLTGLTVSADGARIYLIGDTGITVLAAPTLDVVGAVAVTDHPSCVIESPDATWLYVADQCGAVTVAPVRSSAWQGAPDAATEGLPAHDAVWREPALV